VLKNDFLERKTLKLKATDPFAYAVASLLLFVLYLASGEPVNAIATAMRAKASLDDLLGEGGGDDFKTLLEIWRMAVGDEAFKTQIETFINARKSGTI
jgi:hypothetical protein